MTQSRTESLQKIVTPLLQKMRRDAPPSREGVDRIWKQLVGAQAARHSWPSALSKGRLMVAVDSSGWMYTLAQKRQELLNGLVELLGMHQMKSLSFRIGEKGA
jgi:predicted nucleic acid-binding Zn ribbon protein